MATNQTTKQAEISSKIKDVSIDAVQPARKTRCWMRQIEVILTSAKVKKQMIFSTRDPKQFTISIKGTKHLALNKDKGTVTISNLEYSKIIEIITNEYFYITIKAGYVSNETLPTIFKGEVSFISQKIHSHHDVETYITFASSVVARYSQSRMNFNMNSGINIYAALAHICKVNGLGQRVNIDPELKKKFLQNVYANYTTMSTVFDNLTSTSGEYDLSCDESEGNVINCTTLNNKRHIIIDPNYIQISKGNPTVTSDGLRMSLFPVMNFMPGDILHIDNSLINTSIPEAEQVYQDFKTNYLDQNGQYMVIEIDYQFENRGDTFIYDIKGRALDIIKKIQMDGTGTYIKTQGI